MKSVISLSSFLIIPFFIISQPITPDWAVNASIYELNIRQFSTEGNFAGLEKHLPRLKELGVDIIWLMPINPIGKINRKGSLGSYYSVQNYTEINPEFGSKKDFKNLVDRIHDLGMYVIVDWVANHTAWDNPWVKDHPDFYNRDSLGNFLPPVPDWSDVIDLNYDNKELWKEMTEALKYWVKNFDIDGYRCDVAGMIPVEFWNQVRPELEKIKNVFMLAEWDTPDMHYHAFDMTYDWNFHKLMNAVYAGKKNANDLKDHILQDQKVYPNYAYRMQFTSNHDENSWNGTEFERLGESADLFAVLTYVVPGMPLIYSGQEAALNKRLEFFDKDLIEWKVTGFTELYTKLNQLKSTNSALWNGSNGGIIEFIPTGYDQVLSFIRKKNDSKVISFFNLSSFKTEIDIYSDNFYGKYIDFENNKEISVDSNLKITLDPWSYKLFTTNN